jgi:hypothetical protein
MATRDEYLQQPIEARLARTADDRAAAICGHDDDTHLAQLVRALDGRP